METIVNAITTVRRERLGDRDYLVAPLSMIVPGILPGSDGPLLYPADEVQNQDSVDAWNGIPIVMRHPKGPDGKPTSARNPRVLAEFGLGWVFASNYDGGLKAEAWLDEAALGRVKDGNTVLTRIRNNQPVEVSTGLFTKKTLAPAGSVWNGIPYHSVARNYRPDHLAVLPDEKGACSLADGCGLNVTNTETNVDKKQLVTWLTANCGCWKGKESALESYDQPVLESLKTNVEKAKAAEATNNETTRKLELVTNEFANFKKKSEEDDAEDEKKKKTENAATTTPPAPKEPTPMTDAEWLSAAPPGVKAAVQNAMLIENAAKQGVVDRLTANLADAAQKKTANDLLMNKSLPELQMLASLIPASAAPVANAAPATATTNPFAAFFLPAGNTITPTPQNREPSGKNPLVIPTINWGEESKKTDKERATSGAA